MIQKGKGKHNHDMDNQNSDDKTKGSSPPAVSYYDTIRQGQDPLSLIKQNVAKLEKQGPGGLIGLLAIIVILIAIPFAVFNSQRQTQNKSSASNPTPKTIRAFLTGHVFFDQQKSGIERNPVPDGIAGVQIFVDNKPFYTDSNGNFVAEVIPGAPDNAGNLTDNHHITIVPLFNTILTTGPVSYDRQANAITYYDNNLALKRQNNPYVLKLPDVLPKPIIIGLGRITDANPTFLQGYTFLDENSNGVYDADIEPVVPLVSVTVNGAIIQSNFSGFYEASGLLPNGQYSLSAMPPAGMHVTTPLTNPVATGRKDIGLSR